MTKLVRRGRDVSPIINTLDRTRWEYLLLVAHRGHPGRPVRTDRRHPRTRLQVKADRALKAAMDAMQALVLHHVDADRLVRKLRGPGTLEEFLSDETNSGREADVRHEPVRNPL